MRAAKRLLIFASLLLACATASWGQVPGINSSLSENAFVGLTFTYQISVSNYTSDITYYASDGPGWLQAPNIYGQLIGTPTSSDIGTNTVILSAHNSSGTGPTQTLSIVVLSTPVITSPLSANAIVGAPFSYQIVATNATSFTASSSPIGLAAIGLSANGAGLISGTPQVQQASLSITLRSYVGSILADTKILHLSILPASVSQTTNQIFFEGFDGAFPDGWQVGDANAAGTFATWAAVPNGFAGIATPDSSSSMGYCAGTGYGGNSTTPNYQNNMAAYMQRTFDLSAASAATLSFRSMIAGIEVPFDKCRVYASTTGGAPWTELWNVSRVDSNWTLETIPLNNYAGRSAVTIRFEFDSDSSINSMGWFVDSIALSTGQGDRFDNATPVTVGTNLTSSVAYKNALDVHSVHLRQGYTYVITATGGSLFDPQMWLFDPYRIQVAYNDDARGIGFNSRITWTCPATGDYFVQVSGVGKSTGTYTLSVIEQPAYADIVAESVAISLPDGDPRGLNPSNLVYTLKNKGPLNLANGETYNYQIQVYLSANGNPRTGAGTGTLLGSETKQLDMASGDSMDVIGDVTAYTIPNSLPAGTYYTWLHVTPLTGSPVDSQLTNNWVIGAATNLPPPTYVTISGVAFKTGSGVSLPGTALTLVSQDGSTTTVTVADGNGNYTFTVTNGWQGTISPASTNGTPGGFSPAVRSYTNSVTNNLISQNFAWSPPPLIAGQITRAGTSSGLAGITVVASDGTTTNTDANGNYRLMVTNGFSGTISCSYATAGTFMPASRTYTNVIANRLTQNYSFGAAPLISGKITRSGNNTNLANVTVTFISPGITNTVLTDSRGIYSKVVDYSWSGSVTPSTNDLDGTFSPRSKTYTRLTGNSTAQNFSWIPPPMISGKVTRNGTSIGVAGILITNNIGGIAITASNGTYALTVPYNWSGSINLSATNGGTFTPAYKTYTHLTGNQTAQNFTYKPPTNLPTIVRAAAVTQENNTRNASQPTILLHSTGLIHWSGADADWAQQAPEWLVLALVDGKVKVMPGRPMTEPGTISTELTVAEGLSERLGTANCELIVIRNNHGQPMTTATLTGTTALDAVLFLTPGHDALLSWDLQLLQP